MLAEADEHVGAAAAARARGTVIVGVQPLIAQQCLTAALPLFNALHPEIQLDMRTPRDFTEEALRRFDVSLFLGWPQVTGDLVHRRIGAASYVVCAAPAYWAAHGMPKHPSELARHHCLAIRSQAGTLMDMWAFKRGAEQVSVAVQGWLLADNVHRDMLLDTALTGGGVVRVLDWHRRQGFELASGSLVPALVDWEVTEVPPVNLFYPPTARRIQRVRVFIDFVVQLFREIEQQRALPVSATAPPRWTKTQRSRASSTPDRKTAL
jgi:LysR family transcriptional regulator, regulator for bpeEF and oprC